MRSALLALITLTGLAACTVTRPALTPAAEITETPFFPQEIYQCGPAALATVLAASGVAVTPEELAPLVYIPQRRGSLQTEIIAAARRYARLPYVLDASAEAITAEIRAGRPVLVLQNLGLPWLPRWHYAVVIGITDNKVVLRSGTHERLLMRTGRFLQTWKYGGSWAVVFLRPGEMPVQPDARRWIEANAAFETVADPEAVLANYEAAARTWPRDSMVWLGLGNAYYKTSRRNEAEQAYRRAVELDNTNASALNNLAQTLAERGCRHQALDYISRARQVATATLMPAIRATENEISAMNSSANTAVQCN